MKKLFALILALGMVMGLVAVANAGVTVGGLQKFNFSYGYFWDGWGGYVDNFNLYQMYNDSTRLKVTYTSDDKKFGVYYEIGVYSQDSGNAVSTRRAYMTYSWGTGSLLIGQDYTITRINWPNQILNGSNSLVGYGIYYYGREEQIRVTLGKKYVWKMAIESPVKGNPFYSLVDGTTSIQNFGYYNIPPLAMAMNLHFGNVTVSPYIRWEMRHANLVGYDDKTFHSIDGGLSINGNFGLIGFTVAASGGMNSADPFQPGSTLVLTRVATGSLIRDIPGLPMWDPADGTWYNHYNFRGWGELRIGGLSLGAGANAGFRPDVWDTAGFETPVQFSAYANYAIPFGKMTFIPEVSYFDDGNNQAGTDQGAALLFGCLVMLPF